MSIPPLFSKTVRVAKALIAAATMLASLMTSLPASRALAQELPPSITIPQAPPKSRGEILIVDFKGARQLIIRGFEGPTLASWLPGGTILAVDVGAQAASLLTPQGESFAVTKTWKIPDGYPSLVSAHYAEGDVLTLLDKEKGFVRIRPDSSVEFSSPSSGPFPPFSSSVALHGDRFLVARWIPSEGEPNLILFNAADRSWTPLPVEPRVETGIPLNTVGGDADRIVIFRPGDHTVLVGTVQDGAFRVSSSLEAISPTFATHDGGTGILEHYPENQYLQVDEKGTRKLLFYLQELASSVSFNRDSKRILIAYQIPAGATWSVERDRWFSGAAPFHPGPFFLLLSLGAVAALAWLRFALRRLPLDELPPVHAARPPSSSWWLALLSLAVAGGGVMLAAHGHLVLLERLPAEQWLPSYLGGVTLVAIALEAWRRRNPLGDEPMAISQMVRQPTPTVPLIFAVPLVWILGSRVALVAMGKSTDFIGAREGVFAGALLMSLAVCIADASRARAALASCIRREWLFIAIPTLIAAVTFFYRLLDIPHHCHFDFTFNTFYALQYLRGKLSGAWDWGYVPAPVIGAVPELIGLLLAGSGPLGFRLGNPIFNITAIAAVYLLGRTYRNPRVGMWAAIILAGNIAFMHFARLQSNGSAATTALWALTLFVLAIRHQRVSLWLLLGIVSGFSFYQWPVARVGMTAAGLMYALIFLRYPLSQVRRWKLLLFGFAGLFLMLAPLIPVWLAAPERFLPRLLQSMEAVTWQGSSFGLVSQHDTLQLFIQSFGWIHNETDRSTQGTISPGFNSFEAIVFSCGLAIMLIEGLSINVLFAILMFITLLVCGAWGTSPPWYTRLLPTAPIVAAIAARALEGFHNISARFGRTAFRASLAAITAATIYLSPIQNLQTYLQYETGKLITYNARAMTTIGRRLDQIGPKYTYVFLARGERDWTIIHAGSFGDIFPYIMNLQLKESHDVRENLPVPKGQAVGFLVQPKRKALDLPPILAAHPGATVETITDINGKEVAILALVDNP